MSGHRLFEGGDSGNAGGDSSDASAIRSADFLSLGGSGDDSGDSSGGIGERFDPAIHVSPDKRNADGSYRKKRGRKASNSTGARSGYGKRSEAGYKANIESLTSVLAIVHAGLASATKTPELALESDDAESLAKATAQVLIEFDIQPNPKVQAIVGLVMTSGAIYGPRVYMIRERRKEERKAKNEA